MNVSYRHRSKILFLTGNDKTMAMDHGATQVPVILLTGGTGYVGGRLLSLLEQRNMTLRCLARDPDTLRTIVQPRTEIVQGNVLDPASLDAAMQGHACAKAQLVGTNRKSG